jgi:hypothetical protein
MRNDSRIVEILAIIWIALVVLILAGGPPQPSVHYGMDPEIRRRWDHSYLMATAKFLHAELSEIPRRNADQFEEFWVSIEDMKEDWPDMVIQRVPENGLLVGYFGLDQIQNTPDDIFIYMPDGLVPYESQSKF